MEVHFQFNGKEYVDCILKNYLGKEQFKKDLIAKVVIYIAFVLLFASRIRYRDIRYMVIAIGIISAVFIRRVNMMKIRRDLYRNYNVKDNDVRVMNVKLEDNFINLGQVMEESKYSYEAVKDAYVMGEYLYIAFSNDRVAFVHSRAFQDAESTRAFVECLEGKTGLKVYRKKDESIK